MQIKKKLYFSYLIIEIVLYILFISFDVQDICYNESNVIKYFSLLLTLLLTACVYNIKIDCFYPISLFFIAIADYFLLFSFNANEIEMGILLFSLGHLCLFITMIKDKRYLIAVTILAITVLFLPLEERIYNLAFMYGLLLTINLVISVFLFWKNHSKQNFFRVIGFLFLLFCDFFVGLVFLDFNIGILMWLFYLPSFVFLNISYTNILEK